MSTDTKTHVTPDELVQRFATQGTRTEEDGTVVSRGFCGLSFIGQRDPMVAGFDDGYEFMGYLSDRGWRALHEKGDWPYVVYLAWSDPEDPERSAIVEYCECDFTCWQFSSRAARDRIYGELRDCP